MHRLKTICVGYAGSGFGIGTAFLSYKVEIEWTMRIALLGVGLVGATATTLYAIRTGRVKEILEWQKLCEACRASGEPPRHCPVPESERSKHCLLAKRKERKFMKYRTRTLLLMILLLPMILAAANPDGPPGIPVSANPWMGLITVFVPIVILVMKLMIPRLPNWTLPIIAPLLGAAADIAMQYAGAATLGPVWGAALGSAGVGLREVIDQIRKAHTPPEGDSTPPPATTPPST
jgi:hypothetical protein